MNKRSRPLSNEVVRRIFTNGLIVHECVNGLCIVSHHENSHMRVWADLSDVLAGAHLQSAPDPRHYMTWSLWITTQQRVSDIVNLQY